MKNLMKLPRARTENLVVQNLKSEVLIYDINTNQAFCLNETCGKVFNACDGVQTFEDLKRQYKFTDELIHFAIDELKRKDLIAGEYQTNFAGMTRREVVKKVGLASMIALPVIAGLTAPTAAHAASGGADNGVACTNFAPSGSTECKSGTCNGTQNSTYSYGSGMNSQAYAGLKCCAGSGELVGTYTTYSTLPGNCAFTARCCTGTGTEQAFDSVNNRNVCTCAATS